MERDGLISREVRGKRTYRITLSAPVSARAVADPVAPHDGAALPVSTAVPPSENGVSGAGPVHLTDTPVVAPSAPPAPAGHADAAPPSLPFMSLKQSAATPAPAVPAVRAAPVAAAALAPPKAPLPSPASSDPLSDKLLANLRGTYGSKAPQRVTPGQPFGYIID